MSYAATINTRMRGVLTSGSLTARVMRSSGLTVMGYGYGQFVRLASNLVLTRLLFPEAFGLMGLVTVFMVGLVMFSDFGIGPAISRSARGDDPDFLNTVWTIQVVRGFILFFIGCLLAWPISVFYGQPVLFFMLIAASVQFIILGFMPTRKETAHRHLAIGKVTVLDVASQTLSLLAMVLLAIWMQSVWALVVGVILGTLIQVSLMTVFLPGVKNRFQWESSSVTEVLHFGKWIFLSTICGFLLFQGDKLVLGKYLTLEKFGLYNIGYFLGSFPLLLGMMVTGRLLIPVYRDCPPLESRANFLRLRRLRITLTAALTVMLGATAFAGVWLVGLLYDDRYVDAGAVVVMLACIQIPVVIGLTYDQAALAAGDSRRYFFVTFTKAVLMIAGLLIGAQLGGLVGALIGQAIATLAAYPALVWLSVRLGVWDPLHDLGFAVVGVILATSAIWWNWAAIVALGSA
ncbi:MAG: oligosaccharide flippase family protein [Rhodobacterales bacterium]